MDILIYEDDKNFAIKLKKDILNYFKEYDYNVKIEIIDENFYYENNADIIFMDIFLLNKSGIQIAQNIKKSNSNVIIIFMSNRNDLVFNTLSIGIFQFIRKNNYEIDFPRVMHDLHEYIKNYLYYVIIKINGRNKKIYISNIKYIISIGKEVMINCYNEVITYKSTLQQALYTINSKKIIQIQRSLAINLDYVSDFEKWEFITEEGTFKIGRKYQKRSLEQYEDFLLR